MALICIFFLTNLKRTRLNDKSDGSDDEKIDSDYSDESSTKDRNNSILSPQQQTNGNGDNSNSSKSDSKMTLMNGSMLVGVNGENRSHDSPLNVLYRVFPHRNRSFLQLILQACNGDLVQAIEQISRSPINRGSGLPPSQLISPTTAPYLASSFVPPTSLSASSQPMRLSYGSDSLLTMVNPSYPPHLPLNNFTGFTSRDMQSQQVSHASQEYDGFPLPSSLATRAIAALTLPFLTVGQEIRFNENINQGLGLSFLVF
ncbi:uncharacterized protein TRIADDRAFT_58832 [Trichoplax adhaerens]|uniref:DMA domain-containing protein n=1 Tax=Trichoplax adhaerens TaxID=10228 RepID=B3S3S8_TRIAD|nr:hypothetical protein TRIADDRAFT_58832 [Trichoplax adhaerens]EDV22335.1 hypothetical protein TRIADDRAFT_58832 [Trichoplax adhaerens]|eukprot:XP_002114879.1 hypothetical protein TRIADDRAFT_58832 [Trichoplax adhaerens]